MPVYTITLYSKSYDNANEVVVRFETINGIVNKYSVQYRSKINGAWRSIRRYDNSHDEPHVHVFSFGSSMRYRYMVNLNLGLVMNEAIKYCNSHWRLLREAYILSIRKE